MGDTNQIDKSLRKNTNERKMVGFGGQLRILLWKNWILSKRNTCGLISEILVPIFIILFLILMRYLIDVIQYGDQINRASNVIDLFMSPNAPNKTGKTIMYYPNNSLIQSIVVGAVGLIQYRTPLGLQGISEGLDNTYTMLLT
jgi:hypothetical protein